MKQLRALAVLLMLVSLASLSTVMAQPQFEIPLTVTDGANTYTLYMGIVTGAHTCINSTDTYNGHSESFLPPAPPGGVFDTRFLSPRTTAAATCYDQGSLADYRPYGEFASLKDTFKISFAPGTGANEIISWPAGLGADFKHLTLKYFDGNANVFVDMTQNQTADLSAVAPIATLTIYADTAIVPPPPPIFGVAPTTHSFGNVAVGTHSDFGFTVSNTVAAGGQNLVITAINSSNPLFTIVEGPTSVPPGGTTTYTVRFTPTAAGPANATITWTDNDATNLPHQVTVDGTGTVAPQFNVTPSSHDYGSVGIGGHADFPFHVTNPGTADLHVTAVTPSDANYSLVETVPQTITPGGSFDFTIRFAPTSGGPHNGTVSFVHDAAGSPGSVNVTGSAPQPVSIAPATATIANTIVGCTTTLTAAFTLTNHEGTSINVGPVTSDNTQFAVSPATTTIAAGASATFDVAFTPTGGPATANLSFPYTGAVGGSVPATVSGLGVSPVSVPATTAFPGPNMKFYTPPTCGADTRVGTIVVTNTACVGAFQITGVASTDPSMTWTDAPPVTVPAGGNATLHLQFTNFIPPATPVGPHSGTFTITHSAYGGTATFTATGRIDPCIEPLYVTVLPESLAQMNHYNYVLPKLRAKVHGVWNYPNWQNLLQETFIQGGFRPGADMSDARGGMVVGVSKLLPSGLKDPQAAWAWARLGGWNNFVHAGYSWDHVWRTLENYSVQGGYVYHTMFDRGIDSTKNPGMHFRLPFHSEQYHVQLHPSIWQNELYAQAVALKLNIAGNELGKMGDPGFSQLHWNGGGSLQGMTILQVSEKIDTALSHWTTVLPATFTEYYNAAHLINLAFIGPLDTVSFYNPKTLVVRGIHGVSAVAYLAPATDAPVTMNPINVGNDALGFDEEGSVDNTTDNAAVPTTATLNQNFPNPFNPSTMISFNLLQPAQVTLKVYNILGQEVSTLLQNEEVMDGTYVIRFDGSGLSSGVYYYVISGQYDSGTELPRSVGKMLMIK